MKRKVTMFRLREKGATIPGVTSAKNRENVIYIGMQCPAGPMSGGGVVSDMELVGNAAIAIYKRTADGKPLTDFGALSVGVRGNTITPFEGDGIMWPLGETAGIVFRDVDDRPAAKSKDGAPDAKPGQCQLCGLESGAHGAGCPATPSKSTQSKGK